MALVTAVALVGVVLQPRAEPDFTRLIRTVNVSHRKTVGWKTKS